MIFLTRHIIGKVTKGKEGKPDTTFTMLDEDFLLLIDGKLNPQNAFMTVSIKFLNIRGKNEDQG